MNTPVEASVVVLGATPNPERYAYKATEMLVAHGYTPIPVGPRQGQIAGRAIVGGLDQLDTPVHTLSLYLGPDRQAEVADALLALHPQRVIFNPGTENPPLERQLESAGVAVLEACTLVLLRSGQF